MARSNAASAVRESSISLTESARDTIEHGLRLAIDLGVPESQHGEAEFAEPSVPVEIGSRSSEAAMTATIHFDHQPRLQTGEIDDEPIYRHLPPKVVALRTKSLPQQSPELRLLRREAPPEVSRDTDRE